MKGKEKVKFKIVWEGVGISSNSISKFKFVFSSDGVTPLGSSVKLNVIRKE